jgi:hypothetical protein
MNEVHVVPIEDVIDHEPTDCVCSPSTEPVRRDDGSYGWLIVHHSLDGREQLELADGRNHGGWETREPATGSDGRMNS